jgi:hypothetical protein
MPRYGVQKSTQGDFRARLFLASPWRPLLQIGQTSQVTTGFLAPKTGIEPNKRLESPEKAAASGMEKSGSLGMPNE